MKVKVLDIDTISELNIFDKIVFYIRKSVYKRQTIKKFNKEITDKIGYHELKIYVSWIEPDYYSILSGNHKMVADYGYKEGIDEISKKYALKHSSLHSGYFEIKTKQYKVYKIDRVYQRGQLFLQSSEYKLDKKGNGVLPLIDIDFVNKNGGAAVNQTWNGSQKYFRVKNEKSTTIKEKIDYFGDDYVK